MLPFLWRVLSFILVPIGLFILFYGGYQMATQATWLFILLLAGSIGLVCGLCKLVYGKWWVLAREIKARQEDMT